jgi:mycothiol synthase
MPDRPRHAPSWADRPAVGRVLFVPDLRIELRSRLDEATLGEVLALIDATTDIEGHRPVGEHKYAHLRVGATGWLGLLAYEEGVLIGYAHTRWNPRGQRPRLAVEVVVHPEANQPLIAERLLEETRAVLARAGGGTLWLWVHRVDDPRDTVAAKLGFDVQRELAFMTRRMPQRPSVPELPAGVELRPYREEVDDEAFLEVNNAAFTGHPENGDWDVATFAERRALHWFDPEGLLMAWRGEEAVGFHWTKWHGHDSDEVPAHEPVGEVYVLAVHPRAQGLGLGRALLEAGLAHLYDRSCRLAVLYVDCADTGAVGLYASSGFELVYREVCYETHVQPDDASGADLARPA